VLPSFVQTADAQTDIGTIGVIGDPIDDPWGDWDGWVDDDWGCQTLGCEPSDDDGGGGSEGNQCGGTANPSNTLSTYSALGLPVYTKSGLIQSVTGGFKNDNQCNLTPVQESYCNKISLLLNSSLAALPITGSASSGYTIGELSYGVAANTYGNAFLDIESWFAARVHVGTGMGGIIAWQDLKIDWTQYSWNGTGNPTRGNHGVYQIFAAFLLDLGHGSGVAGLPRPDNGSWSCPE